MNKSERTSNGCTVYTPDHGTLPYVVFVEPVATPLAGPGEIYTCSCGKWATCNHVEAVREYRSVMGGRSRKVYLVNDQP